jgi:hypothetical protein
MAREKMPERMTAMYAAYKAADPSFKITRGKRFAAIAAHYQTMPEGEFWSFVNESSDLLARLYRGKLDQIAAFYAEVSYHNTPEYQATTRSMQEV